MIKDRSTRHRRQIRLGKLDSFGVNVKADDEAGRIGVGYCACNEAYRSDATVKLDDCSFMRGVVFRQTLYLQDSDCLVCAKP